jgi:phosphate transport system permease protein
MVTETEKSTTGSQETKPGEDYSQLLRKRFRLGDWLAEYIIRGVAFLSIAVVAMIFFFVFRESLPLFSKDKQRATPELPAGESNKPEVYDPYAVSENELRPETYGTAIADDSISAESAPAELKPEVYGAMTDDDTEELKPEVYGMEVEELSTTERAPQEILTAGEENRNAVSTLTSRDWLPVSDHPRYGLLPLFLGTIKVTLIAILFAAPIAILAAIYTAMFAEARIREIIKPAIELLAGFPSVVIGFFALMVLATFFQNVFGYSSRLNGFVGGIAMALAAIPVIYTLTEDALSAVPRTYIEASLGLGASLRQTAFQVVLPAATPGIFAAVVLGVGRIFGETMIALMATGNAALISMNPFDSVRTLSATIGAEMAEVVFGDTHYSVLFLIGSLLFIFTFSLNALAEFYFRNRLIRRFQGK